MFVQLGNCTETALLSTKALHLQHCVFLWLFAQAGIDDLVACARQLVGPSGLSSPGQLCLVAESAGVRLICEMRANQ